MGNDAKAWQVLAGRLPVRDPRGELYQVTPIGGNRLVLFDGLSSTGSILAKPTGRAAWCVAEKCRTDQSMQTAPHWWQNDSRNGLGLAMRLAVGQSGGVKANRPAKLVAGDWVEARVVVRGKNGANAAVTLTDARGRRLAPAGSLVMQRLGSKKDEGSHDRDLAQTWRFRIPATLAGKKLGGVQLKAKRYTDVVLLDLTVSRKQAATPARLPSALISAPAHVTVKRGSTRRIRWVQLPISGRLPRAAKVAITIPDPYSDPREGRTLVRWVEVRAGARQVKLPLTIPGDVKSDEDEQVIQFDVETRGPLTVRNPTGLLHLRRR